MIVLPTQPLKLPAVQEIVTDAVSNNIGKNRTLRRISRTGVDETNPVHSGVSEHSTPDSSDNSGTRINGINGASTPSPSGISGTSAASPAGGLWRHGVFNKPQSTSQNIRKSD